MKLWQLSPVDDEDRRWGYDCNHGFIIRAPDESTARAMAAERAADEGKDTWLSPTFSECEELKAEGPAGIVQTDFNAG